MTAHYTNSKGQPVEIGAMLYPHLVNAHAKLVRERTDESRDAEIAAMGERIAALDAEAEAEAEVGQQPRAEVV
jgi:hypothetical protein